MFFVTPKGFYNGRYCASETLLPSMILGVFAYWIDQILVSYATKSMVTVSVICDFIPFLFLLFH